MFHHAPAAKPGAERVSREKFLNRILHKAAAIFKINVADAALGERMQALGDRRSAHPDREHQAHQCGSR